MKILWIPHCSASGPAWEGSRQQRLARHLSRRHDLHWIDWDLSLSSSGEPIVSFRPEEGTVHTFGLPRSLRRLAANRYPPDWTMLNVQIVFQRAVRRIVKSVQPDVVVLSSSHHFTGYPPDLSVPQVFDHVDFCVPEVLEKYLKRIHHVVVVSPRLVESVSGRGLHVSVIPNGVELERYASMDKVAAKERLGLTDHRVISLIGLTCSKRLYFVEAIRLVQERSKVAFVIVGGGEVEGMISKAVGERRVRDFRSFGHVPSAEVAPFFAASDVGLYPGDDTDYYRDASPLKIVEYAAAGCQVVSSPVDLYRLGWPCVRIAEPEAEPFANAILDALECPRPSPDLEKLSWAHLSREFEAILEKAVSAGEAP